MPVPATERGIPTVVAERWHQVVSGKTVLEGAAFDMQGNLMFCDFGADRVMRVTSEGRLTVMLAEPGLKAGGLALGRDGQVFAAGAGDFHSGSIVAFTPGSGQARAILPTSAGYVVNDIVFDAEGGFYFTDFKGSLSDPAGAVFYVAPDMKTVTPVVTHLSRPNGVALSPDGKTLWLTEHGTNRLLSAELENATTVAALGLKVAYSFTGPAPDSMRVDADGNVLVAMAGQGRVLIFSKGGIPTGQILLPGREEGHNLGSTSLALKPGTDEIYIVSNDSDHGEGAAIFRARGFARALPLHSRRASAHP